MEERLEVTILVMETVSSSGGGDSDTEESHNSPEIKKIMYIISFVRKRINIFTGDVIINSIFTLST